jgi:hypothetical protein
MQNGFIERFNRSYREAVVDMFGSIMTRTSGQTRQHGEFADPTYAQAPPKKMSCTLCYQSTVGILR